MTGGEVDVERIYRHPRTSPLDPETGQTTGERSHVAFACAAMRVVAEVDVELGLTRVVWIGTAQDVGSAINPVAVEGQIEGGTAQGLGLALMEEIQTRGGLITNASFTDYLIPTTLDMPPVDSVLVEVPEPSAPYGVKGVGEPPTVVSTAAIVAALRDATGRPLVRVPVQARRRRRALAVFDHVTIRVSDRDASTRFYDTVLRTLGIERPGADHTYTEWDDFSLAEAGTGEPVTSGLHIGVRRADARDVDEFWRAGTEAGYRDDGAPGWRPQYREDYYGSFLLDPDGNSVEAVHHGAHAGRGDRPPLDSRRGRRRGEGLLRGRRAVRRLPAQGRHAEPRAVRRRERLVLTRRRDADAAVSPGVRSGLTTRSSRRSTVRRPPRGTGTTARPASVAVYHEGYYGAFVLDPDGNNVELVNHNR